MDPATRALESRLAPLDKAQLVDVVEGVGDPCRLATCRLRRWLIVQLPATRRARNAYVRYMTEMRPTVQPGASTHDARIPVCPARSVLTATFEATERGWCPVR